MKRQHKGHFSKLQQLGIHGFLSTAEGATPLKGTLLGPRTHSSAFHAGRALHQSGNADRFAEKGSVSAPDLQGDRRFSSEPPSQAENTQSDPGWVF